jgi:hypothetical protein
MIRRFNFTGRKKIGAGAVAIKLVEEPDGVPSFSCLIDIEPDGLPPQSALYVEAYSRFAFKRFSFGTVAKVKPPQSCRLLDFEGSPVIRFRLKIIDETNQHGRILAVADGITPRDADLEQRNRMSLLPVEATELGQAVWKIEFGQDGPVLMVNRSIEGIYSIVAGDAAFQSLVFPEAVRQIIWQIVGKSEDVDPWSFPEDWQARWLKYAMRFYHEDPPAGGDVTESEKLDWLDAVIQRFCEWLRARDTFDAIRSNREEAG